jgi:hypothetical protein
MNTLTKIAVVAASCVGVYFLGKAAKEALVKMAIKEGINAIDESYKEHLEGKDVSSTGWSLGVGLSIIIQLMDFPFERELVQTAMKAHLQKRCDQHDAERAAKKEAAEKAA